jgi:sigma-B regulation protein RsbU (phosphoserine phosphatase)
MPPRLPGYEVCTFQEQSRSVGGDLYDAQLLSDGRLLFLLADVSGKGMGAALLMSNILASFRILYESELFGLSYAVEQVSSQMFKHSAPGDYATLFIGILEPDRRKISYINAGHNPPLIVRSDGSVEQLEPCGIVIGVLDSASWEEKTLELSEGDLLFVYSDGVTEAQHESAQYGEARMIGHVVKAREKSSKEIIGRLMNDVNDFMGDAPRSDDITIMIIKKEKKYA